jgi:Ca2+-binding EF-hand superfamily protein
LQQVPTEEELAQLIETVNPKKGDSQQKADKKTDKKADKSGKDNPEEIVETIDFFKYMLALGLFLRDPSEIAVEVKKAFKVLDRRNNGYLMAADLREFLGRLGDVLTDEEIDEMIKIGTY